MTVMPYLEILHYPSEDDETDRQSDDFETASNGDCGEEFDLASGDQKENDDQNLPLQKQSSGNNNQSSIKGHLHSQLNGAENNDPGPDVTPDTKFGRDRRLSQRQNSHSQARNVLFGCMGMKDKCKQS